MDEQKVVVLSADTHKEVDITDHLRDFLGDGWVIEQISAAPLPGGATHLGIAVLLGRDRPGPTPPYHRPFPTKED